MIIPVYVAERCVGRVQDLSVFNKDLKLRYRSSIDGLFYPKHKYYRPVRDFESLEEAVIYTEQTYIGHFIAL